MHYRENLAIPGVSNLASLKHHSKTKTNESSGIINITEKLAHQHAQNATFGLFVAASLFRLVS